MSRITLFFSQAAVIAACISVSQLSSAATSPKPQQAAMAATYGRIPLSFEANQGQTDPSVQFLSRGQGYTLFLRPNEAVLALRDAKAKQGAGQNLIRIKLAGTNAGATVVHEDPQITKTNYFIGSDQSKWITGVPNFGRVRYRSVYDGIDLVYYGNQRNLEHDFIVAPGSNPAQIVLQMQGAKTLHIDRTTGDLIISTNNVQSNLRLLKPVTYQEKNGRRVKIASSYQLLADNKIGFSIGGYDKAERLIIDPVLSYSTYFGGMTSAGFSDGDTPAAITIDGDGNAYLAGTTGTTDFPTLNPIQAKINSIYGNAFISKLNAAGDALIYSTYLGGSGLGTLPDGSLNYYLGDSAYAIAVGSDGSAYLAGQTPSKDFPTVHPLQASLKGVINGFVAKLDPTGSQLIYSTYLGGSNTHVNLQGYDILFSDAVNGIAVDSSGNAYVAGRTGSADFPTVHPFQATLKSLYGNAFVSKINADGSALLYSTFLGGSGPAQATDEALEGALAIALDSNENIYVAGNTNSTDFPTANPLQAVAPKEDANGFVAKLSADGSTLDYSTYLGGSAPGSIYEVLTAATSIAVDSVGHAYVTGYTRATNFPTVNAFQSSVNAADGNYAAFISKFNLDGASLSYSTYLAGNGDSRGAGIAIDSAGYAYVTGTAFTNGYGVVPYFPLTANALQPNITGAFITKLNPSGNSLAYSSFFGNLSGGNSELAYGIAVDPAGDIFLIGSTYSGNIPVTPGAFNTNPTGMFVAKIAFPTQTPTTIHLSSSVNPQYSGGAITFTAKLQATDGHVPPGAIRFFYDSTALGAIQTPDSSGTATWTASGIQSPGGSTPFSAGPHSFTASYMGTDTYAPSFQTLNETITAPQNSLAIVSGPTQISTYGTPYPVPLVVAVKDAFGNPASGITVTFSGESLGYSSTTAITGSNGQAQVFVTPLSGGQFTAASLTATATATVNGTVVSASYPLISSRAILQLTYPRTGFVYGSAPPTLQPVFTGFVNGDTAATATAGSPAYTTAASATAPVGTYTVYTQLGSLSSSNYILNANSTQISIRKALLIGTIQSVTIHRGQPIPAFTYTLSGFVNGDTQATAVSGQPILTTTATSNSPVGRYPITGTLGTLSSQNYGFIPVNGVLTILP
jgi:hypothetical protein